MRLSRKNIKGYTFIELLMVCALIAVFGLFVYTLTQASTNAYQRIVENREQESSARIAANYIETRIRQGDVVDSINIVPNPLGEGNALKLNKATGIEGESLWILIDEGILYEFYTQEEQIPQDGYGFFITKIQTLELIQNDNVIEMKLSYEHNGKEHIIRRIISPRSMN